MARPKDPRAAAARIKTELAAARLNDDLETELALGSDLDPEWERRAEEARADLASRFGGFERLHEVDTSTRPSGRRRSGGGSAPHSGRRRSGSGGGGQPTTAPAAPPSGRAPASPRKPAPRTTKRAPRGGRGGGAGRRALEQTGIPSAGRGGTAFALEALGLMIGLALLYLLLNNAERAGRGGALIDQTLGIFTGIVRRFISPMDPLAGRSSAAAKDAPTAPGTAGAAGLNTAGELGGFPRAGQRYGAVGRGADTAHVPTTQQYGAVGRGADTT